MSNIGTYFDTVKRYRRGLDEINQRYDTQLEAKEGYRGSAGYAADVEKIEGERMAEIQVLRTECSKAFDACLASMQEHAARRPMPAPSQEQLALLQALQMREHLSRDELEHAATSLQDCPVGLGVLEELGRKHEVLGFHAGGAAVSDQFIRDTFRRLTKNARTTLSMTRTNQRRRLMDPGGKGDGLFGTLPTMENIGLFKLDIDPESAQECAGRWGGVPEDVYEAFCKVVNG